MSDFLEDLRQKRTNYILSKEDHEKIIAQLERNIIDLTIAINAIEKERYK